MSRADDGDAAKTFDGRPLAFGTLRVLPTAGRPGFELREGDGGAVRHLTAPLVLGTRHVRQYLTPAEHGRWQALPIAFDVTTGVWFDMFPERPTSTDWDHWTNPGMTANSQCLACHTTGFERRYIEADDRYATRWSEADVGCESCHGPGRAHVDAHRQGTASDGSEAPLLVTGREALTACVPCHSRRLEIAEGFQPGARIEDYFDVPEMLDTDIYHADGQVRGEAYEWWSFQMSRMAALGVSCLDCHEPHAGRVRTDGDGLCLRCHPSTLATPAHTHHDGATAGARCVGCHMPTTTFMERDPRHDHGFQRPDPEGQVMLGTPDVCTRCHQDKPPQWASGTAAQWYTPTAATLAQRRLNVAIDAGRRGDNDAVPALLGVLRDRGDLVRRASAARLLAGWTDRDDVRIGLTAAAAADPEALVRSSAVQGLGDEVPGDADVTAALLHAAADGVRLVRLEAAFALRATKIETLGQEAPNVQAAFEEWLAAQKMLADLPEPNHNRGRFLAARGDRPGAESAYRAALSRWPRYAPAREDLAALLADAGRLPEAESELRELVHLFPDQPRGHFLLGLYLGRHESWVDGAKELEACLAIDPDYPRARYNLGLLYAKTGTLERANEALEAAAKDPAARVEALRALVRLASARKDSASTDKWLVEALRAAPESRDDPMIQRALAGDPLTSP